MRPHRQLFRLCAGALAAIATACGTTEPTATTVTYAAGDIVVERSQPADTRPLVMYVSESGSGVSAVAFECHLSSTARGVPCNLPATLRIGVEYSVAVFVDDQQAPRETALATVTIRGAALSRQGSECAIRSTSPCWPVRFFTIVNAEGSIR